MSNCVQSSHVIGALFLASLIGTVAVAQSTAPRIVSVSPSIASAHSALGVYGYRLGTEDWKTVAIHFVQGDAQLPAQIVGSTGAPEGIQSRFEIVVPAAITNGQWQLVIAVNGQTSAPAAVEIVDWTAPVLDRLSPELVHPGEMVSITVRTSSHEGDEVELTDGSGNTWRVPAGASDLKVQFKVPDDMAEGKVMLRVGRTIDGADVFSQPLSLLVTSGPRPLSQVATRMKSVAPGQWTDLLTNGEISFDLKRSEQVDVEFRQGVVSQVVQVSGPNGKHVQIPPTMAPGEASLRNRTWQAGVASDWSAVSTYRVLERPAAPFIVSIGTGPFRQVDWSAWDASPRVVRASAGEALDLRGHFPVASAADLIVRIEGQCCALELRGEDVDGGVRVVLPSELPSGDWRLTIAAADGLTPPQDVAIIRVITQPPAAGD